MAEIEEARPGEPTVRGEGEEGFPHGSKAPFVLATGIFGVLFGFIYPLVWVLGVPIFVAGLYLWIREYAIVEYESGVVPEQKRQLLGIPSIYLAVLFAIVSELLMFGGAFIAWFFLEAQRGPFPNLDLPALDPLHGLYEVVVLLAASVLIYWAQRSIAAGKRSRLSYGIVGSFVMGLAYLVLVWLDWSSLAANGLTPDAGAYGAAFYYLTGLHAVHVVVGLVLLAVMGYRYWSRGHFSENRYTMVRVTAAFWYFLTGVSVVILFLVYLPTS